MTDESYARAARAYENMEPPGYDRCDCTVCDGTGFDPEEDTLYGPHHESAEYYGPQVCTACDGTGEADEDECDEREWDREAEYDDRERAAHEARYGPIQDDDLPY